MLKAWWAFSQVLLPLLPGGNPLLVPWRASFHPLTRADLILGTFLLGTRLLGQGRSFLPLVLRNEMPLSIANN